LGTTWAPLGHHLGTATAAHLYQFVSNAGRLQPNALPPWPGGLK
jgi:hypothetical protein